MATIYDVAKEAGVSIATVSKVINETGRISDKTRQHVRSVMKRLDYQPSLVASALTKKRTNTIGLLLPDLGNLFFAEVARSVEDRAHEKGYNVVICSTDNDADKEEKYLAWLRQKRVDGIILATGMQSDKSVKSLLDARLPVALIARESRRLSVDTVRVDDFRGGYLAASHLVELGHTRIAVIAENLSVSSSRERVEGYKKALEEAGLAVDEALIRISSFDIEGGKEAARQLLELTEPPTAVFACNDLLAIGILQVCRAMGLAVPARLSVVGFDNTLIASLAEPPLTTIAQPIPELGREVVDLITQEIHGEKQAKQRVVLDPRLIRRGSTASAPEQAPR
ncbi:LacI family transcriptional regulator [Paenibacillus antri]|uniref:LacI family transcriptional regulator n=1 Tax=Paenibacillus antri TaxID=2582848 RepID=A0A5R9GA53_9BACL|nr:LacI family DNA-binding transcriptional regulator [Paenibacillus antri]TLS49593.1 LacI family transcriptional regulator [Paenibacillus antri]